MDVVVPRQAKPRESVIERYFRDECRTAGFLAWKFISPARSGVPDRMVVCPRGIVLVELKRPGESPDALQRVMHDRIRARGGVVYVIASRAEVDAFIAELTAPSA